MPRRLAAGCISPRRTRGLMPRVSSLTGFTCTHVLRDIPAKTIHTWSIYMSRKQIKGYSKNPWTLDELRKGLEDYYEKYGCYPSATEIDSFPHLPSSRSIQRRFGGVIEVRKTLRLNTQTDLRTGEHSSKRAHTINDRAHKIESDVYLFLKNKFGEEFVHREYFFSDDKRTRADFFIYDKTRGFCVDVFYPKDRKNLTGCLNSKLKKYTTQLMRQYPVIFLQMNRELSDSVLSDLVKNKKNDLGVGQSLMGWEAFETFCKTRTPLKIRKGKRED